jgi:hypothetical protein
MMRFICLLAVTALLGCNRSQKELAPKTAEQSTRHVGKGMAGPGPKRMKETPKDWPMTFEQLDFLMTGSLEWVGRKSVDLKALNEAGFKTTKDLVAFAWDLLGRDLEPIRRDQGIDPGYIHRDCYLLIGLHGDLEDASRLYHRLKSLVRKPSFQTSADELIANNMLAQSMGLFLMRDHFMPQEDRALMEEIEQYLLGCTIYGTPSCWPTEGIKGGDDGMRRYALKALAMSCGEKGRERIQEYADDPESDFSHIIAEVCFKQRDRVLGFEDDIKKTLSPVFARE